MSESHLCSTKGLTQAETALCLATENVDVSVRHRRRCVLKSSRENDHVVLGKLFIKLHVLPPLS